MKENEKVTKGRLHKRNQETKRERRQESKHIRNPQETNQDMKSLLQERQKYLLQLKEEKEKALINVPAGTLRFCSSGGRTQYYHRTDPKDVTGVYIREEDIQIARQLAQKDYDRKVLSAVDQELKAIGKYLVNYPLSDAEQIYEKLRKERQKLIMPIRESDEHYIQAWENVTYQGKEFPENMPELFTAKGERVRSKSEIIIADTLSREGVPYRYECPVHLNGIGLVFPDFTVLNLKLRKEMYWEHLGMMDDPDYVETAIQKISSYEQNGIFQGDQLILTYETKLHPLNQKQIGRIIQHYLL